MTTTPEIQSLNQEETIASLGHYCLLYTSDAADE